MKRQHPTDPNLFWCPKCKIWNTTAHFYTEKRALDGMGACKEDARKRMREYNSLNYDKIKVNRRPYFEARRISGEKSAYDKKWREENKEQKKATDESWRRRNWDRVLEGCRIRSRKNWDKHLERCRKSNERLLDSVVRGNIWKSMHIKNPSQETIASYRLLTKLRRELKQLKGEMQNGIA